MAIEERKIYKKFSRPADLEARQLEETESHINRLWQRMDSLDSNHGEAIQKLNTSFMAMSSVSGGGTTLPSWATMAENIYPFIAAHLNSMYLRLDCSNSPLTNGLTINGPTVIENQASTYGLPVLLLRGAENQMGFLIHGKDSLDRDWLSVTRNVFELYCYDANDNALITTASLHETGAATLSCLNNNYKEMNVQIVGSNYSAGNIFGSTPYNSIAGIWSTTTNAMAFWVPVNDVPILFATQHTNTLSERLRITHAGVDFSAPVRYVNGSVYGTFSWSPTTSDKIITFPDATGTVSLTSHDHSGVYEPVIAAGTTAQYWRGDKTWQDLPTSLPPAAHQLDGAAHTVSGLTTGHFLKATGATTFGFAAHGLTYSDVGAAASGHNHDSDYISVVATPTAGNFPVLTAGGELENSFYGPASFAPADHHILSVSHGDTTAAAVVRGDIITGQGATPVWARLAKGAVNTILSMGADEPAWATRASLFGSGTDNYIPKFVTGATPTFGDSIMSQVGTNQIYIPGSTTNSSLRIGTYELQGHSLNNAWLGENGYYNGSDFKYRADGYASWLYFYNGDLIIRHAVSGTAGATAAAQYIFGAFNAGGIATTGGGAAGAAASTIKICYGAVTSFRYPHFLASRHNGGTAVGNAIELHTGDGTAAGTFASNAVHGITIENGLLGVGTGKNVTPASKVHALLSDATTNVVSNIVTLAHNTSGTAAAGFGSGILGRLESSTTADQDAAQIAWRWRDATHASRTSEIVFSTVSGAAAIGETQMFTPDGGFAIKLIAGEALVRGNIVYINPAGAASNVYKNPIDGDMPIGVVYADASATAAVWIVVSGKAYVLPESGVSFALGDVIYSSDAEVGVCDGAATVPAITLHMRECGHALAASSGNGVLTLCVLHFN